MKIYLKTKPRFRETPATGRAGKALLAGLNDYRHLIDSVSVYLHQEAGKSGLKSFSCRLLIQTIHGGNLMITAKRRYFYQSLVRAIAKSKQELKGLVSQLSQHLDQSVDESQFQRYQPIPISAQAGGPRGLRARGKLPQTE